MTAGLAPLSEVLEEFDLELLWLNSPDKDNDKMCGWAGHKEPVKADSECICLGCGKCCGYVCNVHERECIAIMTRNTRGHRLRCKHCGTDNNFTFVPIPK